MRRILLIYIWCSCLWVWGAVAACADDFVHLDWTVLTRDSLLPPAHHFYELGVDWQNRRYWVKMEYPEYEPLTSAELGVVRKRRMVAGDTLQYTWQVGVSRKEGVGELNICPSTERSEPEKINVQFRQCWIFVRRTASTFFSAYFVIC